MDPPDHTRLRRLVSSAFTPRTVERLRPHVTDLVSGMLDAVDPSGFDGPVHLTGRIATQPSLIDDVEVAPGQGLVTLLAAANRDPARFADPDRVDIRRPDVQHLTFSHGIHYCLGAALARLEGQEAFKQLTQRFPTLELAEEPIHREHFVLRGYQAVHVTTR